MHQLLLEDVRGAAKMPGQFRQSQNWITHSKRSDDIASARFVPAPPEHVLDLMLDLENYWRTSHALPAIIRLALIHYQFETIHPFLDGNGRLGRLLMAVLLDDWKILRQPLLYLSNVIERSRGDYHDGMLRLSQTGEWNEWLRFFLQAVLESADDALNRGNRLLALRDSYRAHYGTGATTTPLQIIDALFESPTFSPSDLARGINVSFGSVQYAVSHLVDDGVVIEITGRRRNRVYAAPMIIRILNDI